jgi:cell wall assembly regulator SMI1
MSWGEIENWVRRYAPALHAAFLPAADVRIAGLPPDLAAWWQVFGGVDRAAQQELGPLIPVSWDPLGPDSALRQRETCLRTHAGWLPEWLPIAADCFGEEGVLFVDLREGPAHGNVVTYEHGHGAYATPDWTSVTAMLEHVLRMLQNNDDPVYRRLVFDDGHIYWDVRPTLTPDSRPLS